MLDAFIYYIVPGVAFFLVGAGVFKKLLSFNIRQFLYSVYWIWVAFMSFANVMNSLNLNEIKWAHFAGWISFAIFVYYFTRSLFFIDDVGLDKERQKEKIK
jgi:hypothetical protein